MQIGIQTGLIKLMGIYHCLCSKNNQDVLWFYKAQNFDVLLAVHLSIFISEINQLDAQNLFYNKFISCLYMFRAPCAHCQEVENCITHPLVSSHL